ncbi:hypothetical protein BJ165DRAFT_1450801 [Panaeolus papilionaceus]|nr:hypothetical protein BJ165DRAFT_1450801 [Panaeolus papilionaceus]
MASIVPSTSTSDYGCSLQKEVPIPGRLLFTDSHVYFHADISGSKTDISISIREIESIEKRTSTSSVSDAIEITTQAVKSTFASFLSLDTAYDAIVNAWRHSCPENNAAALVDLKPYRETALDAVIPGSPERVYNLMFSTGFLKEFMSESQMLLDVQISEWETISLNSTILTRNTSYIKPLNYVLGPKQTKCEITEEVTIGDRQGRCVSVLSTTRTPDVPSGSLFSVKTQTCITRETGISSRVLVTTELEWMGRSFIKSIVERSAIDGQKTYYTDLERAMRQYISQHESNFMVEDALDCATDGGGDVVEDDADGSNEEDRHGSDDSDEDSGDEQFASICTVPEDRDPEEHDFEMVGPERHMVSLEAEIEEEWDHIDDLKGFILEGWRG